MSKSNTYRRPHHVAVGSNATEMGGPHDVRFTLNREPIAGILGQHFRATIGLLRGPAIV